jgi:hypothetical protein
LHKTLGRDINFFTLPICGVNKEDFFPLAYGPFAYSILSTSILRIDLIMGMATNLHNGMFMQDFVLG